MKISEHLIIKPTAYVKIERVKIVLLSAKISESALAGKTLVIDEYKKVPLKV